MKIRPLGIKCSWSALRRKRRRPAGSSCRIRPRKNPNRASRRVGEGKLLEDGTRKAVQVKKGDLVLFTSYAGTEIKVDGKEYLIMDESDIMAVIEK